jgi:hypothetical protein
LHATAVVNNDEERACILRALSERVGASSSTATDVVNLTTQLSPLGGACLSHPIPRVLTTDAGVPPEFGWGRAYTPRGTITLAGVSRADRSALLRGGELSWDVDMRSAQPTLLLELLETCDLDDAFPCLTQLVSDPDAVRGMVLASGYPNITTLEDAKAAITRLVFGASCTPSAGWLREFADEMSAASYMLLRRFPEAKALQQARDAERARRDDARPPPSCLNGSALSFLLSTCERWCVCLAMKELADYDGGRYQPGSYLYDGFLVQRPLDTPVDAPLPEHVLEHINGVVRNRTGWKRVTFVQKQLATPTPHTQVDASTPSTSPPSTTSLSTTSACTDQAAARLFLDTVGREVVKMVDGALHVYDRGLWTNDPTRVDRWIYSKAADVEGLSMQNPSGKGTTHYGANDAHFRRMKSMIAREADAADGMIEDGLDSFIGHLLFSDGVLDMTTGNFISEFNPNLTFVDRINRPFRRASEVDPDVRARVEKILFCDPFTPKQVKGGLPTFLKVALGRALAGDYLARAMYLHVGATAAGKGVLVAALRAATGTYFGAFNLSSVQETRGLDGDAAKAFSWLVP